MQGLGKSMNSGGKNTLERKRGACVSPQKALRIWLITSGL